MQRPILLVILTVFIGQTNAAEPTYQPSIAAASDEGQQAIQGFRIPAGMKMELFAAEPMLANPVAFCLDERGRVYVAETFRQQKGVEDNRSHMSWLDDDLAANTVEDRLAYFKKHLGDKVQEYAKEHDRIRLLEDADGDGRADRSTVFADGFNDILDGTGAGLLARYGEVYYTCIPNLWLLLDRDGNGRAEERTPLHHGYGVRVAFRGHDLHGLRIGPDGRLYFSIGDRGFNVKHEGRHYVYPDTGAVLRCNLDGSELEVFATGLRNPQELAFDDFGNLFTCDNNSDSGDQARWVYVVEGGDSGWRMTYQYLKDRGPWNREKLWHPAHEGQPAWIVPPLANLADGPSGLAYYPGTGLPDRYQGHFFLADFRGGPSNSGIRTFANKPKGAAFELIDSQEFLWSILATDVDFGPNGLYISDWVNGWNGEGKGRIYRLFDPKLQQTPVVDETKRLIREGMAERPLDELAKLLEHADQRVRQEAQFELATRGEPAVQLLAGIARGSRNRLARLHAIWALGQLERKQPKALHPVLHLLIDNDAEVRCQAVKVIGDVPGVPGDALRDAAFERMLALLSDPVPRVRFFAATALGKLGRIEVMPHLWAMLKENAERDPFLRHAGVMGLTALCKNNRANVNVLLAAAEDTSPAVRMGVLLVLRQLRSHYVARFLNDRTPALVDEASRAINDIAIDLAMPQLADILGRRELSESAAWRALNANYRLGGVPHAAAVAAYAAREDAPDALRIEALELLASWEKPSNRDRVMGSWRPLEPRSGELAAAAIRPVLGGIFNSSDSVRKVAARVAGRLGIKEIGPTLASLAADSKNDAESRMAAIKALESLRDERLENVVQMALADKEPLVRSTGRDVLAALRPAEAVEPLATALERGETVERQGAVETLASLKRSDADAVLERWMDTLLAGKAPPEIELDLLEAARSRETPALQKRLADHEAARPQDDPLAKYRESLHGGDARRGRQIFLERATVSCVRCHKVQGAGGEVGPDLTKIATDKKREYLLEAIVDPNRSIAKGFETVVLTTLDGSAHIGILKSEDEREVRLMTAEGKPIVVSKSDIDERGRGKSAMPDTVVNYLTKSELRDLVEFLAELK